MVEQTTITCFECDKDFDTSESKQVGDKFSCSNCGQKMEADMDCDEDGYFWFAVPAKSKPKTKR